VSASRYPVELVRQHRLSDGRTVTIRPVRSDDGDRIRDFLNTSSEDSRYKRFQKWIRSPSSNLVHFLTDIDYDRHLALVCTTGDGADATIVGDARYIALPDGKGCDFGVLIGDAWRRSGIAGLLMQALIRAAKDRGFEIMESIVLSTNAPMLRFAHALGFEVETIADELGTVRIWRRLQTGAPPGATA
jgi:RimJ/RimL family protein N-acetyltransferase